MQGPHRQSNILSFAVALITLAGLWLTLAPVQIGGPAAYIIVNGNSMEPLYHRGDLVILHVADVYEVGDIVTYRHPDIGPVIHRIIEQEGNQFTLRGDHNTWNDTYRPTGDDVIGKAWLHIPSVGKYLTALRSPFNMAILAIVLVLVGTAPARKQKFGHKTRRKQRGAEGAHSMPQQIDNRGIACVLLGVIVLISLVLTIFAFLRPVSRTVATDVTYQQSGQFDYTATAPSGIYDADTIKTGDPIYRQITRSMPVKFDYLLTAQGPIAVAGTYRLNLEISDGNGWRRTVELQSVQNFTGPSFTSSGIVDLANVDELIASFEKQTGSAPANYTLTLVPTVQLRGEIGGQALQDEFRPRLDFQLTKSLVQPVVSAETSPFKAIQTGVIKDQRTESNTLSLGAFSANVASVRGIGPLTLGLALLSLIVVGGPLLRRMQRDEVFRIRLNYSPLLVGVRETSGLQGDRVIDVTSIDDLAKLAERTGGPILYNPSDLAFGYVVLEGGITYRYPGGVTTARLEPVEVSGENAWQQMFLDKLRETGRVATACSAAGVWLTTVNQERVRSPEFAKAWDMALAHSRQGQLQGGLSS